MRVLVGILFLFLFPSVAAAATYYMAADGSGDFSTLQEAIDACVDGDSVVLADGVYHFEGNLGLIFWGKDIFFGSASDSPENCIIDVDAGPVGYKFGFNISHGESRDCIVQGLTVCNGRGTDGGAFHIRDQSNPTIRNCILRDNYSTNGGGAIKAWQPASPSIEACHVFANAVSPGAGGGGIAVRGDSLRILDCIVESNDGGAPFVNSGGSSGILADGSGLIRNTIIRFNFGGGYGGGLGLQGSVTVEDCQIYGNQVAAAGGGIKALTTPWTTLELKNCTIVGNAAPQGGAIQNKNLFVGYPGGPVELSNCVVSQNSSSSGPFYSAASGATFTLACSDVWGNEGGDWVGPIAGQLGLDGNISADPRFCDADNDDYALREDSPCLPENNDCRTLIGALGLGCTLTAVPGTPAAGDLTLSPNHPNPFNARTSLRFNLPVAGSVDLRIYDPAGRERAVLLAGAWLSSGTHRLDWDGRDRKGLHLPSGVYLCRLETSTGSATRKLTLLQ